MVKVSKLSEKKNLFYLSMDVHSIDKVIQTGKKRKGKQ
jgi:hypothetical protein